MQKTVTLRCPSCGATHDFTVGAGPQLSAWREIAERIPDKKERENIAGLLAKMAEKRSKAAMKEVCRNAAEPLNNVRYEGLGEDAVPLLEELSPEQKERIFGEKVNESIASSKEKWAAAAEREGIVAFEAIYLCPKSRKPKQGLHFSLRVKDEKGVRTEYVYKNKCDDCASTLTLANDGDLGFMHEDCATVARCPGCGAPLAVDKVSFKLTAKEQEGEAQQ